MRQEIPKTGNNELARQFLREATATRPRPLLPPSWRDLLKARFGADALELIAILERP